MRALNAKTVDRENGSMPLALLLFMFLSVMTVTTLSTLVYSVSENDREIAANQAIAAVDSGLAEASQSLATLNKYACQVPGQVPIEYTVSADNEGAFRWWADKSQLDEGIVTLVSEGQSANAAGAGTRVSSQTFKWDNANREWELASRNGAEDINYPATDEVYCAPTWTALPLAGDWENYNTDLHYPAEYAEYFEGTVALRGAVAGGINGTTIGTLPANARPSRPHYFKVDCQASQWGTSECTLRVATNGDIIVWDAPNNGATITRLSLDMVRFDTRAAKWQDATLQNSWSNVSAAAENIAQYKRDRDDSVFLHGRVEKASNAINTVIFTLPASYRPQEKQEFNGGECLSTSPGTCTLEVRPNGEVVPVSSSIPAGAEVTVSLDAVRFDVSTDETTNLTPTNGWSNIDGYYGLGVRPYSDTTISLRGTVGGGTVGSSIADLPDGMRPEKRQNFVAPCVVNGDNEACVVQVRSSGALVLRNAPDTLITRLSLDGIRYQGSPDPDSVVVDPPDIPMGLAATATSSSQIDLSWQAVPGATSYLLLRGENMAYSGNATSFSDTGLEGDTTYTYTVKAVNGLGVSEPSDPVSATTSAAVAQGTFSTSFNTNIGVGAGSVINDMAIDSEGRVIAAGAFTSWNGDAARRIIRLNADGTVDPSFNPVGAGAGPTNNIEAIAVDSQNRVVVVGSFTSWNGDTVGRIVRLNSDGSVDTSFSTAVGVGANAGIKDVAIQSDGKIVLAGLFSGNTGWNGIGGGGATGIVRLNEDGSRDTSFAANVGTAGINGTKLALTSDQKIVYAGNFSTWNGTPNVNDLVLLNPDGTRVASFSANVGTGPGANVVTALAVDGDDKILYGGGSLTTWNAIPRSSKMLRLNADGTIDQGFDTNIGSGANGTPRSFSVQPNQQIVAVGAFTGWGGIAGTNRIVRLNSDGTRDDSFSTTVGTGAENNTAWASIVHPTSGQIFVGGSFTDWNTTSGVGRIVRLD